MTKKEVPKHIKEFYDRHEKVRKLLDSTQAAHSAAYNKGIEVIKDDKGEVDYEKLEDTAVQDQFLDKMMDHYLDFAVKKLGLKEKPKDEWEQDVILGRYVGVTRGQLRQTLRKHKGKYTLKEHEGTRDKLIKKQGEELSPLRYSHLEKKHIDDIIKHVELDKNYFNPDALEVENVVPWLESYKQLGKVPLEAVLHEMEDVFLSAKGKEYKKKMKDQYKHGKN